MASQENAAYPPVPATGNEPAPYVYSIQPSAPAASPQPEKLQTPPGNPLEAASATTASSDPLPSDLYPWAKEALENPANHTIQLPEQPPVSVQLSHKVLGSGRFGVVVKARNLTTQEDVAVKLELLGAKDNDPRTVISSIVNKAKNLLNNNNPEHEVRLLKRMGIWVGQCEQNEIRFTVMKLLPGITMEKYFKQTSLTSQEYLAAYKRVLDGLTVKLHSHGILHGAPHQNNVLLDRDTTTGAIEVYFIDFGRGRDMGDDDMGERGYSRFLDCAIVQYYLLKFAMERVFESEEAKENVVQTLREDLKQSRKSHMESVKSTSKYGIDGLVVPIGLWKEMKMVKKKVIS
jgi:tRNA A-37 threonylcarbamoyl transferase component Bud32